mgnify:CR=1 FL=1
MKPCANHPDKKAHRCGLCSACYAQHLKARDPEGYLARQRAAQARYRERHPERANAPVDPAKRRAAVDRYREANKEVVRARSREWYHANRERALEYRRQNAELIAARTAEWIRRTRPARRAATAAYRAALIQATPAWADQFEITNVYVEAEYFQMEVDHIVPLRGKLVCGLHVPENLQLLTRAANAGKGSKFDPTTFEA